MGNYSTNYIYFDLCYVGNLYTSEFMSNVPIIYFDPDYYFDVFLREIVNNP